MYMYVHIAIYIYKKLHLLFVLAWFNRLFYCYMFSSSMAQWLSAVSLS